MKPMTPTTTTVTQRYQQQVQRKTGLLRVVATILVAVMWVSTSDVAAIAQAEQDHRLVEITEQADARAMAVEMLDSALPASQAAAVHALSGSDDDFATYAESGMELAQQQDLRQILVTISAIGGPTVQDEVATLLDSGDTVAMAEFIDSGWQHAQAQDDRATAWEAAEAPEGSSLKQAADAALQDGSAEALADFVATEADTARAHDRRREVYELIYSPLPTVAANASEAIRVGTDTAIEQFLRYGQFVAAAQDAEKMEISQLVTLAVDEAGKASEANSLALQQADRAARAADNARRATEKARDEALAADAAQVRAGNAASAAGQLANQTANVADQAVAAAQDAKIALQQTADALSRAASAAGRAQAAAGAAAAAASAASWDAGAARDARIAAEQARNAAQAAEESQRAYEHAATSASYAQSAGQAAGSAAVNADAAASAATDAANAAGVSEEAAAEAREGAARARAAAGRARAAASEVDQLVGQIQQLVEQTRIAAEEAAEHARRSAEAAEEAAREAGNADYAARMAGVHADDSAAAAEAAQQYVDLAEQANEIATTVATDRLDAEKTFLRDQATVAREIQDAQDAALVERDQREQELIQRMEELTGQLTGQEDTDELAGRVDDIRHLALVAAQVGTPAVAGAAKVALEGGTEEDLIRFVAETYEEAIYTDDRGLIQHWWQNDPDEAIRKAADNIIDEGADILREFVTVTVPEMRIPGLVAQTWQLRETAGDNTRAAADEALQANTYEALNGFVNEGGYQHARQVDQIQEAYRLVETGGPEVSAAAEAAVVGDRAGLNEFITIEQYRRQMLDDQRDAHNAQISAMLDVGRQSAQLAAENAANARAAHHQALGSAQQAAAYAAEAADWAGQAQESARLAGEHVTSAERSLEFARIQQERAQQAAASAEADAAVAAQNADRAGSYAANARAWASEAAASASSARASANAAGQDAQLASQAAQEAYDAAWEMELAEQAQAQDAARAEVIDNPPVSVMDTIKGVIGAEALDLILDVLGVTDVLKCFQGSASSCLWAAVGLLPLGKAVKMAKALPAFRKLIGKVGDVRAALNARKTQRTRNIDDAITGAGCTMSAANYRSRDTDSVFTFASYRVETSPGEVNFHSAAAKCDPPRLRPFVESYRAININELTPDELNVYMRWNKSQPLSSESLTPFDGGRALPAENLDEVVASLQSKIDTRTITISNPHPLNSDVADLKVPVNLGVTSKKGNPRKVAQDQYQNKLSQAQMQLSAKLESAQGRLNQRDTSFSRSTDNEIVETVVSRGRPDNNLYFQEHDATVKIEYDTHSSQRDIGHAWQQLDANPDAQVILVELTSGRDGTGLNEALRAVIDENLEAIKKIRTQ